MNNEQNRAQYKHPVKTAAEGLKRLVETKKVSRNVNYEAMRSLFSYQCLLSKQYTN